MTSSLSEILRGVRRGGTAWLFIFNFYLGVVLAHYYLGSRQLATTLANIWYIFALAYLLPAALWAFGKRESVIVPERRPE